MKTGLNKVCGRAALPARVPTRALYNKSSQRITYNTHCLLQFKYIKGLMDCIEGYMRRTVSINAN